MNLPSPLPRSMKFLGPSKDSPPRAPFGISHFSEIADSILVAFSSCEEIAICAQELPDPDALAKGTWVIALAEVPAPKGLLSMFSATKIASRRLRASALLVRGFVDLGAGIDPQTRLDLVWGRAR